MKNLSINNTMSFKQLRWDILKICGLFIVWRLFLVLVILVGNYFIPNVISNKYLGGGYLNYQLNPAFFSLGNFDGEHFLSISIFGYQPLENAFFPLYPLLINFFSRFWSDDFLSVVINSIFSGIVISNFFFLLSLIILYELILLKYSSKVAFLTILLLLSFPTSFYFVALYSESLFLFLALCSFLCFYKKKYFWSGVFGFFASLTRVFGFIIFFSFLLEIFVNKIRGKNIFWLGLIPLGLVSYMAYLWITTGDPVAFYTLQTVVGEQHQRGIILLPQVYFRYIKILFSLDITNPIFQTIFLELFIGVLFLILPIYGFFKKMSIGLVFFAFVGFILTTVQGSFSSLPRYILVLFPSFISLTIFLNNYSVDTNKISIKTIYIVTIFLLFIYQILELTIFMKGYWVS